MQYVVSYVCVCFVTLKLSCLSIAVVQCSWLKLAVTTSFFPIHQPARIPRMPSNLGGKSATLSLLTVYHVFEKLAPLLVGAF